MRSNIRSGRWRWALLLVAAALIASAWLGIAVGPAAEPECVGVLALAVEDEVAQQLGLSDQQKQDLAMLIDTRDSAFREQFTGLTSRKMRERDRIFRLSGIDSIDVRTNLPYVEPLRRFFRMREKRR